MASSRLDSLSGELLEDLAAIEPHVARWSHMAADQGRPYCTPAWMLGWWAHARPARARLRAAVALDGGGDLVGIAPFYGVREHGVEHLRPLAAAISHRAEPLAARGREGEVAPVLVAALAGARPRPGVLAFTAIPEDSPWPALVARHWPTRLSAGRRVVEAMPAPLVTLRGGTFDEWFAARSGNFRSQLRRARRSLEQQGAVVRVATAPGEIEQDLDAFIRLHLARWDPRGGSGAIDAGAERMLRATAQQLVADGHLRLVSVALGDRTIAVQAMVCAGGEVSYWLGGFDEDWASAKPGLVALLAAVEDAFARGHERLDLGGGAQDYKLRFADSQETLVTSSVVPRGALAPLDWALLAPSRARTALGSATYERRAALRRRLRAGR